MGRRTLVLADQIRRVREGDNGFDLAIGDGQAPVFVSSPELWPDAAVDLMDSKPGEAARIILGQEEYARYAAAGGTAAMLFDMVREVQQSQPGESGSSTES